LTNILRNSFLTPTKLRFMSVFFIKIMKQTPILFPLFISFVIGVTACSPHFDPKRTFTVAEIKTDYAIMRGALEEAHPGLYRYTSRDSMAWIFNSVEQKLNKPMTEREFRKTINPVFSYVRCGHTDIYQSAAAGRFYSKKQNKPRDFPLSTVYLERKLRVFANNSADSSLKKGAEILAIDGHPIDSIIAEMGSILASDGYNQSFKTSLINANFSRYYWVLHGDQERFKITFKDSTGHIDTLTIAQKKSVKIAPKNPKTTTKTTKPANPPAAPKPIVKAPKENKKRNFKFATHDSTIAILDINTFSDGGYKRFYKKSFRAIKERGSKHLIIDLRANGGGRSDASINLMTYFIDTNFVAYDTVFAKVRKTKSYEKYFGIPDRMIRFASRNFWSKRLPNGGMKSNSEGRWHKPNRKYHFDGSVYVLTNGGSFSATSIFSSMVNEYCPNVTMIGRETGGGRYGCNAMISPYMVLPNTHARVRMPMFKIVLHIPGKDQGHGVMPEYPVERTFDDVIKNRPDSDFEKAYELIKKSRQ
jgi:C-terminal processing protease CtpA/Prc